MCEKKCVVYKLKIISYDDHAIEKIYMDGIIIKNLLNYLFSERVREKSEIH